MNEAQSPCSVCGAWLRRETITFTQTIRDSVYIVTDVPADVCVQCGEQYLSPDTVGATQTLIESGDVGETRQVPVYRLAATAPS